jgi:hypothetical protein
VSSEAAGRCRTDQNSLVNAGRASSGQPKRFYKFALTDPVDQPFATFKYYYRTWEQLQSLGMLDDEDESGAGEDNMSVIEPCGDSNSGAESQRSSTPEQRRICMPTPRHPHRLSVPPSITLDPPSQNSRPLPTAPHKSDVTSSTAYRPHGAYAVDEWRVRTPSPVKSVREGITTPPMEKRKDGLRASSFMSALTSTWKRRGTPSAESHDSRSGARSAA